MRYINKPLNTREAYYAERRMRRKAERRERLRRKQEERATRAFFW